MEIGVPMCHDFWLFEICKNVLIEVYLIYNIVLVSGMYSRVIQFYMHFFQIIFHYRLLQDAEYIPCGFQ